MGNLLKLKNFLGPGGLLFFESEGCEELTEYDCSNDPIVHYIGNMIETVGLKILIYLDPKICIPNTEEISYSAIDIDTAYHLLKGNMGEMRLGTYKDELYRGHNYLTLSRIQFLSLTDIKDQYLYILDRFIESLERYFKYFDIEANGLLISYEKVKENDFLKTEILEKNKKKAVAAVIQSLEYLNGKKWFFKIVNFNKEVIFSVELKEFDFYGSRIKDGNWVKYKNDELPISHSYMSLNGWEKDVFRFTWGFPERSRDVEYYEFSLKTMELTQKK